RHVAGDLLVRDHDDADLGQHGPDHPLGAVLAGPGGGRARLDELAAQPLDLPAPPEVAAADAQGEREIEQHDDLPDGHPCTCSAEASGGTARTPTPRGTSRS